MSLVEERGATQVLPPRVEPVPEEAVEAAPPEPEPTRRPRLVRWLGWMAGLLLIGLISAVTILLITSDDAADETALTTAAITEARVDAAYAGPAQLPGGVLPANLVPAYDNPAQLPGGVLPANLAPGSTAPAVETTLATAAITEARVDAAYAGPAQLPGGVLPANLVPAYDNPAQLPGGVLPANLTSQ